MSRLLRGRGPAVLSLALAAGALLLAMAPSGGEHGEPERNRALAAHAFEAWAAGTGSPYDLLAPNARWTIAGRSLAAGSYPTRDAFLAGVIRPFNARMRGRLVPTVRRLYAEGDTVIVLFDASGTARDGEAYTNSYAWFLRMRDGKIVEARAFFDSIAFDELWRRVIPAP